MPNLPVMPFHQFKQAIAEKLIDDNLFSEEFLQSQQNKLELFWDNQETVDYSYDIIKMLADARLEGTYHRYPTMSSLASVGCEF